MIFIGRDLICIEKDVVCIEREDKQARIGKVLNQSTNLLLEVSGKRCVCNHISVYLHICSSTHLLYIYISTCLYNYM